MRLPPGTSGGGLGKTAFWFVLCGFLAAALFFLITQHRAHLFGALPYLIFAACPLMHLFMHGGHGGHRHQGDKKTPSDNQDGDPP